MSKDLEKTFYDEFLTEDTQKASDDEVYVPKTPEESFQNVVNILETRGKKLSDNPYWSKEEYETLVKRDINAFKFIDEHLSNVGETDIYYKVLPKGAAGGKGDIDRAWYNPVENAADTLYAFEDELREDLEHELPHAFQFANLNPEEKFEYYTKTQFEPLREHFPHLSAMQSDWIFSRSKSLYDKHAYSTEGHMEYEAHEDLEPIIKKFMHSGKVTKKYVPLTYIDEDGDTVEGFYPAATVSYTGADISDEDKQKFIDTVYEKMETVKKIKGEEWWKDNKDLIVRSPKYFDYIISGKHKVFDDEGNVIEPGKSVLQEEPNFLEKVWNYIKGE